MKYTNKQRAEIYLEAAERIHDGTEQYACLAIKEVSEFDVEILTTDDRFKSAFPEFHLFDPHHEGFSCGGWWGEMYNESTQLRILALLFAYQMAIDP